MDIGCVDSGALAGGVEWCGNYIERNPDNHSDTLADKKTDVQGECFESAEGKWYEMIFVFYSPIFETFLFTTFREEY